MAWSRRAAEEGELGNFRDFQGRPRQLLRAKFDVDDMRLVTEVNASGFAAALTALFIVGCSKLPNQRSEPSTRYDPLRGCCGEDPERELLALQRRADFEVAKLDAGSADWSVYAHHPNVYVRALSLLRLRNRMHEASDAELRRVAELLTDGSAIYSAECASLLTSCAQGQGLDMHRGLCQKHAQSVGGLADELLTLAPPERVVLAIVSYLVEPGFAEVTGLVLQTRPPFARLRDAAAQAPNALTKAIAERFVVARPEAKKRLLAALALTPLGSAEAPILSLVAPSLASKDAVESALAAVAIVRLTDHTGSEAAPVNDEPRKSAVRLLEAQVRAGKVAADLSSLGSAGAVLLDAILTRIEPARSKPELVSSALREVSWVASMGPRASRASGALFALAGALAARRDRSDDSELAALIRALGAIGAPPAELTAFVLGHLSSQDVFSAGASALLAVKARLSPDELTALRLGGEEHCTIPRHPRAFDGSWDDCFAANDALSKLEGIAKGEPPPGSQP